MIVSRDGSRVVSSLGWVDQGGFWTCATGSAKCAQIKLCEAKIVSLHAGRDDHFAALHHFDGRRVQLTAHRLDDPAKPLATLVYESNTCSHDGDASVWQHLPGAYAARYAAEGTPDYVLFYLDADGPALRTEKLFWYDESYDHKQQGICGVTRVPGKEWLIIAVQRNSLPVLYDPVEGNVERKIDLADRNGNPEFRFRAKAPEVWVSDYDHLLRLEVFDWSVLNSERLQDAPDVHALFIGEFAFDRDETLCAVARPFSNDVVGIDTTNFKQTHRAETGGEPFEVALLDERRVVARDLRSGDLLQGVLEAIPNL